MRVVMLALLGWFFEFTEGFRHTGSVLYAGGLLGAAFNQIMLVLGKVRWLRPKPSPESWRHRLAVVVALVGGACALRRGMRRYAVKVANSDNAEANKA